MANLTRRQRELGALALALLLVTLPFVEMFIGTKTGMYNDLLGTHPPRYVAAWANLRAGRSPFWWKTILSGFNALGAGQTAVFYLPNAVFGWLHPVTAFRCWFFFHLWLGATGWFIWSLRRWGSLAGAVVVTIIGSINGSFVSHFIDAPFLAVFALAPWIFYCFDRLIEVPRARWCAGLALLLAGVGVAGQPQMFWVLGIGLAVMASVMTIERKPRLQVLVATAFSVLLGLALSAMALVPQMLFSRTSVRPVLGKAGAFEIAEEPRHLWTLIAPNIMGGSNGAWGWKTSWLAGNQQPEQINYLGITGLVLAVIAVVLLRRSRFVQALLAMSLFALLVALANHTFFGAIVYDIVPFANRFRVWSRTLFLVNVSVAILAGAGIAELLRRPRRYIAPIALSAAGLAVLLAVLPAMTSLGGALLGGTEGAVARLLPALFIAGLACAVLLIVRRPALGIAALIVVCALDLGSFATAGLWRSQGATPAEAHYIWDSVHPYTGAPIDQPGGLDRWVSDVADSSTLWPSELARSAPTINGYDSLMQADYSLSVGDMSYNGYLRTGRFWAGGWLPDILRTTTLIASDYAPTPASSWTFIERSPLGNVYSYAPRLAEAYLVGRANVSTLDDARVALVAPDTDLRKTGFVDVSTIPRSSTVDFALIDQPGASGSVLGGMNDGGAGTWTVEADRASLFVASWAWMKGWTATVDGRPAPVARTNALVLGVPVPSGSHVVRLHFTPPGWTTGRNISFLAIIVVITLFALDTRRVRQRFPRLGHWTSGPEPDQQGTGSLSA